MRQILDFLNRHALFIAIFAGAAGYPLFRHLTSLLPTLIFFMLFFTFCKINPLDLRLRVWHALALVAQMGLGIGSYYLLNALSPYIDCLKDRAVIESVMLCFIMPTATAAPIIAGKLGGSIQNLTMYTLVSNFAIVIIVPLFFPLIHPIQDFSFQEAALLILKKVGTLLVCPFVAAWALRLLYDLVQKKKGSNKRFVLSRGWAQLPFYLWVGTILILMGDITDTLIHGTYKAWSVLYICIGATISCFLQFYIGRYLGFHFPASSHGLDYQDVVINPRTAPKTPQGISRVTAGQALGQKNTTLAIWMAQAYLSPLTALGPAAYMIVQNLFNANQLRAAAAREQ